MASDHIKRAAKAINDLALEWFDSTMPPEAIETRLLRFFPEPLLERIAKLEAEVEQLKGENVRLQQQQKRTRE